MKYTTIFINEIQNLWQCMSIEWGLGISGGLIATTIILRGIQMPIQMYSQLSSVKMSLLHPDMEDFRARIKNYQSQKVGREKLFFVYAINTLEYEICQIRVEKDVVDDETVWNLQYIKFIWIDSNSNTYLLFVSS